jgi:hypothetical protein
MQRTLGQGAVEIRAGQWTGRMQRE